MKMSPVVAFAVDLGVGGYCRGRAAMAGLVLIDEVHGERAFGRTDSACSLQIDTDALDERVLIGRRDGRAGDDLGQAGIIEDAVLDKDLAGPGRVDDSQSPRLWPRISMLTGRSASIVCVAVVLMSLSTMTSR